MNEELARYIETEIIPRYDNFDKGHRRDHVEAVIRDSLEIAEHYPDVDKDMVYAIAAFHDTGLSAGREHHHEVSRDIILNHAELGKWFSRGQIETMAEAAEDHRASAGHEPRSIYGCIVAEADRQIDPETVIRRIVQYGLAHYPEKSREGHFQRMCEHLEEKYAEGGYLKLYVPFSKNGARLAQLRELIKDREWLRTEFDRFFDEGNK